MSKATATVLMKITLDVMVRVENGRCVIDSALRPRNMSRAECAALEDFFTLYYLGNDHVAILHINNRNGPDRDISTGRSPDDTA